MNDIETPVIFSEEESRSLHNKLIEEAQTGGTYTEIAARLDRKLTQKEKVALMAAGVKTISELELI